MSTLHNVPIVYTNRNIRNLLKVQFCQHIKIRKYFDQFFGSPEHSTRWSSEVFDAKLLIFSPWFQISNIKQAQDIVSYLTFVVPTTCLVSVRVVSCWLLYQGISTQGRLGDEMHLNSS